MAKILIKNGRVWDGEKFFFSDVLTEHSIISKIEPNVRETADFVFDAKGKIVSSGLVDLHVHIRGISSEKFGIQAEMSCFPFGVTAAADAGGGRGSKELLDSLMLKNVVFVSVGIKNNTPDFERAECWLERYGDRAIGLKVYFDTEIEDVHDISPLQKISSPSRKVTTFTRTISPLEPPEAPKRSRPGQMISSCLPTPIFRVIR